jgi:hypothetical protein
MINASEIRNGNSIIDTARDEVVTANDAIINTIKIMEFHDYIPIRLNEYWMRKLGGKVVTFKNLVSTNTVYWKVGRIIIEQWDDGFMCKIGTADPDSGSGTMQPVISIEFVHTLENLLWLTTAA